MFRAGGARATRSVRSTRPVNPFPVDSGGDRSVPSKGGVHPKETFERVGCGEGGRHLAFAAQGVGPPTGLQASGGVFGETFETRIQRDLGFPLPEFLVCVGLVGRVKNFTCTDLETSDPGPVDVKLAGGPAPHPLHPQDAARVQTLDTGERTARRGPRFTEGSRPRCTRRRAPSDPPLTPSSSGGHTVSDHLRSRTS